MNWVKTRSCKMKDGSLPKALQRLLWKADVPLPLNEDSEETLETSSLTEAMESTTEKNNDEENQPDSTTTSEIDMTSNPAEETVTPSEPQTTVVDCVSSNPQTTSCPACPTIAPQTTTSCPPCPTMISEITTDCTPCPTMISEITTDCTPCPTMDPETTTSCPPCETTPQPCPSWENTVTQTPTDCPPCTTVPNAVLDSTTTPPTRAMTPKDICDHLKGMYDETNCRYTCKRYRPYKIIFEDYMVNGEECWLAGKKGTCQLGMGCKLPLPPPSWW